MSIDAPEDLSADATATYKSKPPIDFGPGTSFEETRFRPARPPEGNEAWDPVLSGDSAPQFQLVRVIGRGGMGEVWESIQLSLGRTVAVKRLSNRRLMQDADGRAKADFRQEALLSARLEHPNIVPIYDLGSDDSGEPLLAMKLVQGETWEEVLAADFKSMAPLDLLGKHVPTLIAVGQAVAFAHSRGIIHRDIKPSQVLIGEFGEVLLTDWGLALFTGREDETDHLREARRWGLRTRATASNPSGTPALMAPEQTESDTTNVGPWTDIFLLGATLYYLLTGTFPHTGATSREAFERAARCEIDHPGDRAPHRLIPDELADLAMQAMRAKPEERPASALGFVRRLQAYMSGAGRREESRKAVAEARGIHAGSAGGYARFADALAACAKARDLWPENEEARVLADEIHEEFAEAALASKDLLLARLQAEALDQAHPRRAGLLQAVDDAEEALARQSRQRAFLMRAAVALLALLAIVMASAFFVVRESLGRETEARRMAQGARGDAEAILSFMVGGLYPQLQQVGRLDILVPVTSQAIRYYEEREALEGALPPRSRIQQSRILLSDSRMRYNLGDLDAAIDRVGRAMAALDQVDPSAVQPHDIPMLRGDILHQQALCLIDAGNMREAGSSLEEALGEMLRAFDLEGRTDWQILHSAASVRLDYATLYLADQGRWAEAHEEMAEVERLLYEATDLAPPGHLALQLSLLDLYRRGSAFSHSTQSIERMLAYSERGMDLADRLRAAHPDDVEVLRQRVEIRGWHFMVQSFTGDWEQLGPLAEELFAEGEDLVARSPMSEAALATHSNLISRLIHRPRAMNDTAEFLFLARRNHEVCTRLAGIDPAKFDYQVMRLEATAQFGRAKLRAGEGDQARRLLLDALQQGHALADRFSREADLPRVMLSTASSTLLGALQNGDEAVALEAIELGDRAVGNIGARYTYAPAWGVTLAEYSLLRARFHVRFSPPEEAEEALRDALDLGADLVKINTAFVGSYMSAGLNLLEFLSRREEHERLEADAEAMVEFLVLVAEATAPEAEAVLRDTQYGLVFMRVIRASSLAQAGRVDESLEVLAGVGIDEEWLRTTQFGNLVKFLDPIRDAAPERYAEIMAESKGRIPGVSFGQVRRPTRD